MREFEFELLVKYARVHRELSRIKVMGKFISVSNLYILELILAIQMPIDFFLLEAKNSFLDRLSTTLPLAQGGF